jgi:hypothetical protein
LELFAKDTKNVSDPNFALSFIGNYSGVSIDFICLIFRALYISRKVRKDYRKECKELIVSALRSWRFFSFAFLA